VQADKVAAYWNATAEPERKLERKLESDSAMGKTEGNA
jgi:hypothetical protein